MRIPGPRRGPVERLSQWVHWDGGMQSASCTRVSHRQALGQWQPGGVGLAASAAAAELLRVQSSPRHCSSTGEVEGRWHEQASTYPGPGDRPPAGHPTGAAPATTAPHPVTAGLRVRFAKPARLHHRPPDRDPEQTSEHAVRRLGATTLFSRSAADRQNRRTRSGPDALCTLPGPLGAASAPVPQAGRPGSQDGVRTRHDHGPGPQES